jgi:N-acetylglutamate synthase
MDAIDDILAIEERALNAWPALQTVMVSGWALRMSGGFTKRANSINALSPRGSFEEVKTAAETLFASAGLPAIFRISPLAPPEAEIALATADYSLFDPSIFMTAMLDDFDYMPAAQIDETPSDEWLEGFASANNVTGPMRLSHDAIVHSIAMPAAFVTVRDQGKPVGFGLGVYERGFVGLFDIVVVPELRRHGIGREVTKSIMSWGCEAGAKHAYLNVRCVNEVALNLYSSLGFSEAYAYHYRMPPR